jgi:hypothetical protein
MNWPLLSIGTMNPFAQDEGKELADKTKLNVCIPFWLADAKFNEYSIYKNFENLYNIRKMGHSS